MNDSHFGYKKTIPANKKKNIARWPNKSKNLF
jgi:hypothetical protein